ncbi:MULTISPECIES: chorismate mutase [unclassified Streptomyces]|uniref:chorismate mutase n=1 Tax=unclassified Streptomyces TaxID=2593676 RepID=UPI0022B697AB|nr:MULTISPECIES: chorismate mutase [unclassified Streptomyces]MCZ7417131.1 chorismate mutase [Streptomyces sp. WMMC897]MCZ7417897.1 chorismate mutase [Streptomyces sp. WMMC897]MCZ7417908.1 chorismate mutase [Streptomyces sp. WMMC897]MCZ7433041.1 chorismate mutase [Streptomyces sp. WMMC1477]
MSTTTTATAPASSSPVSSPVSETTDPASPEAEIATARERIDALDAEIIALVRERMAVSATIQEARIAGGGRRVHLSREMEILTRFRAELGGHGTTLAMTLLELSRGRV